jgi:hypothetical protein
MRAPVLLLLLVACASSPGGASRLERVPSGDWGGEHVRLTVASAGGTIEFDCAHGTLGQPLDLDAAFRFDVRGTLVGEGGPVHKDETENAPAHDARGHARGRRSRGHLLAHQGRPRPARQVPVRPPLADAG